MVTKFYAVPEKKKSVLQENMDIRYLSMLPSFSKSKCINISWNKGQSKSASGLMSKYDPGKPEAH